MPRRDADDGYQVDQDDAELEASGYKREMPRQFSMFSLMALAYALICTWNGFASAIGNGLMQASCAGSLFMLIPTALFIGIVSLGMAELTSAFPVAGGQYYWAYILSPPEWAPFASYCVIGVLLGVASTSNFTSGMILSITQFIRPEYAIQPWHKYLVYLAVIYVACAVNVFGSKILPAFNKFVFYFSITTFIATTAAMLICSYPNYNLAKWVFTDTTVSSGWDNLPLGLVLCFVNNLYGFLGTDAGVHMTEEIPNPSVNGPKVIVYPVLIGFATVFPFACACMFVIKDMDEILHAPSGLPLIQLYYQATNSPSLTVVLMIAFTLCFFACVTANVTGSSRSLWSAARDECFPRSDLWKKVSAKYDMPLNAVLLQAAFTTLYGLVFLGSETAFSLMVSVSIIFLVGSYVIPQAILTFRDREKLLPKRPFSLGRYGRLVNLTSTVWTVLLCIACCIPTKYPITPTNVNYNSAVAATLVLLTWLGWVLDRKTVFKGPNVDQKLLAETRRRHMHADEEVDERTCLIPASH